MGHFGGPKMTPLTSGFGHFRRLNLARRGPKRGPKWVILDPFWTPPGALLGPLFDPFWAVLGQIVRLASLNLGPRPGGVPEGVQNDPF